MEDVTLTLTEFTVLYGLASVGFLSVCLSLAKKKKKYIYFKNKWLARALIRGLYGRYTTNLI